MNDFYEWYYKFYKTDTANSSSSQDAGYGWEACKQRILEILTDNSNQISRYTHEDFAYMSGIDPEVVEKIKKL